MLPVFTKQDAQLKSAQREGKPDFSVGYMFQQTGGGYRDYYMLTVSMRLPRRKRVEAGVAEAAESLEQSKQELDSQVQQQLAAVQKQYVAVTNTAELLTEYQDGLLPQAQAAFRAEQTTYQSGKQAFAPVLSSLLDVLTFEHDYQQALLDHETALARLETLTGAQLR
jgi:outer membrane protein, heavy metal efflux system